MREWIGLLLFSVLCGCETIVDFDIPDGYQSSLVVQSHFSPDSLWSVQLSKSVPLRDTSESSELLVSGATVIISGEDNFRDTLQQVDHGIYRTLQGHRPIIGVLYRVQVKVDGFPDVEAFSQIPLLSSELVDLHRIVPSDSSTAERFRLRFTLKDQPDKNYYRLNLYQAIPVCETEDGLRRIGRDHPSYSLDYRLTSFQSNSPSFTDFAGTVDDPTYTNLSESFVTAYFSDQLFESTTRQFEITFEPRIFESIRPHYRLALTALSDDLFAFERSLDIYDLYVGLPNISQRNPAVVYTNVQNGFGIFAGYSEDNFRFDEQGNEWEEERLGVGENELAPCL